MSSLRWRILAVTLAVVFLPVWWMQREAVRYFNAFSGPAQERHMREVAAMTGELLLRMPRDLPGEWIRLGDTLRPFTASHGIVFQVYDRSGERRVSTLADSAVPVSTNTAAAALAQALRGGYKAAWELSPDRSYLWYHCAEPVSDAGGLQGVVLVSRHTSPIMRAIRVMIGDLRVALWVSLGLAAVASVIVAWTLTRKLRRLTRSAGEVAAGLAPAVEPLAGRDEIASLSRAFATMTAALDRRNRYNREFVSSVLHELKTPLTAIRGAAELLQQGAAEQPAPREKFLGNILHATRRMSRLVGELNLLTRVDAEAASAPRESTDLCALVRALESRAGLAFEGPRARLAVHTPPDPVRVTANPGQIEQVLFNLLDNAFRYTPEPGEVRLSVRTEGGFAFLRVEDDGPGIAPANLPKVFDRFFTTEAKGIDRKHGSGLGLAIAKSIVESHGGVISAESEPGRGARFTVQLPAEK